METSTPAYLEELRNTWKSQPFSLGIPIIDLQHIWLVHIIIKLEVVLSDLNRPAFSKDIKVSFSEALDYVSEHFALEENILEHFNYPDLEEHVKGHRLFVERLIEKFHGSENSEVAALGLLQILKKWLFQHILHDDRAYSDYFNQQSVNLRDYCNELLQSGQFPISKAQFLLYQNIQSSLDEDTSLRPTETKDVVHDIRNIWKTYNLVTHIPIIDLQHIWLLKMVVELDRALKSGEQESEVFQRTVNMAIEYTQVHFTLEEKIMRYFRFVDVVSHMSQHKRFVEFVKLRYEEFKNGDSSAAQHLVQDLKNWLLSHIAFEDKKIGFSFQNRIREILEFTKKLHARGETEITPDQQALYKAVIQEES
ncbi:bacteriohemerythrin [Leptospira idonii]|uniref:Hemerythrin n=1 Tax=Leptospira idonii TaxID=1193500 RepID=A0A4R9LYT9_9LEPT|nr:hemerythrin family protein [Leptospira idonii]TGN18892.1 hemerythrin [Leptospira idonii]